MKPHLLEALRWTVIVLCGGCAIWLLSPIVGIIGHWDDRDSCLWFVIPYYLLIATPFLAAAYFCYRRQYRKIYLVVGTVGCAVVYLSLMSVPIEYGLYDYIDPENNPWSPLLGFLIVMLSIVVPIYAAAWFYRAFDYMAHRNESVPRQKTIANTWLVFLGLCLIFAPTVTLLGILNSVINSPSAAEDTTRAADWIYLTGGVNLLGVALIIAGLVWRRPVVEPEGESLAPSDDGQTPESVSAPANSSP